MCSLLLPGQLMEKLAECEDVLGDIMMDIRPKLSNVIVAIVINSRSSRTINNVSHVSGCLLR